MGLAIVMEVRMSPLSIALLVLALPLATKDVSELDPFDDSVFDAAFGRLRGRKTRPTEPSRDSVPSASRIPFIGGLIKCLPGKRSDNSESPEA
ncbi:MAG TPA: hypothetical protein VN436_13520 [Holophaga sp.]|nr:hypothetical protein [Holophaga sp.]